MLLENGGFASIHSSDGQKLPAIDHLAGMQISEWSWLRRLFECLALPRQKKRILIRNASRRVTPLRQMRFFLGVCGGSTRRSGIRSAERLDKRAAIHDSYLACQISVHATSVYPLTAYEKSISYYKSVPYTPKPAATERTFRHSETGDSIDACF